MSERDGGSRDPLDALERALGHRFADRALLETALQHASWANERENAASNDRLEFLGDAVLGLVVGHLLLDAHPDWREGELTRARHRLVEKPALAARARELRLGEVLRLGGSELAAGGAANDTILSDALEAVVGALYLDGGLAPVMRWAREVHADALAADAPRPERDPKMRFQEWAMERTGRFPTYEVIEDTGRDADEQRFRVRVVLDGEAWGEGVGRTKRAAQRAAAEAALERMPA
jgi:ribonuclease-3